MNNFRKTMINIAVHNIDDAKLIPNSDGKFIRKDIELVKFLSYFVNDKCDRINHLLSKDIMLLSNSEYEEIRKYKMYEILNKYVFDTKNCTPMEYKYACNYLYEYDIYELIKDIFSKEERLEINKTATLITEELSLEELSEYLNSFNTNTNLDKYNSLDIKDAYLLHILQNKHRVLCEEEHKKEFIYEKSKNDAMAIRNMKYFI